MVAIRFSILKSLRSSCGSYGFCMKFSKYANPIDGRPSLTYISCNYSTKQSGFTENNVNGSFKMMGIESLGGRSKTIGMLSSPILNSRLQNKGFLLGISPLLNHRSYSSPTGSSGGNPVGPEAPAASSSGGVDVSNSGVGGNEWIVKVKDAWQSTVDAATYSGQKAKEASTEVTPYVEQLLDAHPYLREVIVPIGGTMTGTLLAWFVMPRILRRFHKYSTQGPAALLTGSSLWGPVPYEKSFWGALEDPVRYLITFMAFSQIAMMVAPTTIASQYLGQTWRGAFILSAVWFLHRWKTNVITRALAVPGVERVERDKLLTVDKISSVGLFVLGGMALAEACGVAVQSILTVGGIGGVATAFAARDILGNVLSGLSVQISRPFSIGDTIKAGSVEGQVVEMGLTTTSLLSTERFPVIVPNSLFSSQVIVNKSRAGWRAMVTKIPLHIGDFDKIPQISDEIKTMLASNSNIFLKKEPPYCYLSRVERYYAELTIGCNLNQMSKDKLLGAEQDILLQSVQIIKKHGATLGSTMDDVTSQ